MIIIPEIQKVVILVPRTGSGSLRRAVALRYPKSFLLYRHMEADGVPHGYDFWEKFGVVRNPMARLWSLYKFLSDPPDKLEHAFKTEQRKSVQNKSFCDWVLTNDKCFMHPEHYHTTHAGNFMMHCMPENKKSQFIYLRPDLGTKVFKYHDLAALEAALDINLSWGKRENETAQGPFPAVTYDVRCHIEKYFSWDLEHA